jgi:rRNA-processing protein FCF1
MHSAAFKGDDPVKERLKKLVAISSDEEVQKAHDALYKMATGEDEATKEYAKQIRDNMPIFSEDGSLAARLRVSRKGPASGTHL